MSNIKIRILKAFLATCALLAGAAVSPGQGQTGTFGRSNPPAGGLVNAFVPQPP